MPYRHGLEGATANALWQPLFDQAKRDSRHERRAPLAQQRAQAERGLWDIEDDIGKAVADNPPPIVTALLKGILWDRSTPRGSAKSWSAAHDGGQGPVGAACVVT